MVDNMHYGEPLFWSIFIREAIVAIIFNNQKSPVQLKCTRDLVFFLDTLHPPNIFLRAFVYIIFLRKPNNLTNIKIL